MSGAGDGGDKREDVCPGKGEGGELVGAPAGGFCFHSERGSEFMDGEPNGEKTGQVWGVRGSMRIIEWMERRNTPGQHCWTPGSLQSSGKSTMLTSAGSKPARVSVSGVLTCLGAGLQQKGEGGSRRGSGGGGGGTGGMLQGTCKGVTVKGIL